MVFATSFGAILQQLSLVLLTLASRAVSWVLRPVLETRRAWSSARSTGTWEPRENKFIVVAFFVAPGNQSETEGLYNESLHMIYMIFIQY